jgi:hypothetical protein
LYLPNLDELSLQKYFCLADKVFVYIFNADFDILYVVESILILC